MKYAPQNSKNIEYGRGYIGGYEKERKICPYCKSVLVDTNITVDDFVDIREVSNYNRKVLEAMIELKEKDIIEYELKMSQFRTEAKKLKALEEEKNKPKCSKCGCAEFVPLRKKWSLLAGFATNKVEMVCKNCGAVKK